MEDISKLQIEIENIIIENTYPAKEITSMIFEFMKWRRENCSVSLRNTDIYFVYDDTHHIIGEFTDNDLFQYWWDNIKNK